MRSRIVALLCAGTIMMATGTASAQQTGTPAFRVPIGGSSQTSSAPPVYAWLESVSECSSSCGPGTRTTSYQCQNAADFDYSGGGYGAPEEDSLCTSSVGPKPSSSNSSCTNYSGCGYDWVKPPVQQTPTPVDANPVGRVGCGYVHAVFSPYCQRTGGGSAVVLPATDHAFCRNDTPDYNDVAAGNPDALGFDRFETQLGACNTTDHEWRPTGDTGWGDWSSTCSSTATKTRVVSCYRRFDGKLVDDSKCDAGSKPATSKTQAVYDSCSYDWIGGAESDWSAWSSTCSNTATRSRNPQCRRSNGDIVADSSCTNAGKPKPVASQTQGVSDSCTYSAGGTTTNGAWSSTCSSSATRTVTRQCMRSTGDVVADSECANRGIPLTSNQTQAVYDSCSYSFSTGGWSDWSSHCSNGATRTRSVTCMRSDGTALSDAECTNRGESKPAASETQGIYDACSYAASGSTSYGGWNSNCSSNAQRTVTRQCIRSDGNVVADAECTNRGIAVATTQNSPVYDGCTYGFSTGGWSDWNSHCSSNAVRSRSVTCMRSDGAAMSDTECTNRGIGRPPSSESSAVYDGCGYSFNTGGWSDWNSHCSGSATRTRSVTCVRSDGTAVADAECTNRGVARPASSDTAGVYDACGYSAGNPGAWSDWNSHCSANASRTRTYQCIRSDGNAVASSECTNRGIGLVEGQNAAVYDGCGYSFSTGGWSDWNSHCSSSATRTRSVTCVRSDGTAMADAECTNRGVGRPASSETTGVYDGCGYSAGGITGYSDWNSHCSGNATRTEYHQCVRADGTAVADAECTNRGVSLTTTSAPAAVYDGCSYTPRDMGRSACSAQGQQNQYWDCTRSDGTTGFPASYCGKSNPEVVACTPPYTYAWNAGGWSGWNSGCSATATRTRSVWCQRSDGATVDDSQCGGGRPASSETSAQYYACGYSAGYGGWSSCPKGSGAQQSRVMTSCTRSDGAQVDGSFCNNAGQPSTQYQGCDYNPGGYASGYVLGTYALARCNEGSVNDYPNAGTMPGIDPNQCRTGVATYYAKCSNGGNFGNNPNCQPMAYVNNPRGPSGYPCDITCR